EWSRKSPSCHVANEVAIFRAREPNVRRVLGSCLAQPSEAPNPMKRSDGRILTTHAGSLPRPLELTALHAARARGERVEQGTFETLAAQATREVIARQIDLGLDVVNNGEVGRESFFTYLRHRMTGFGGRS